MDNNNSKRSQDEAEGNDEDVAKRIRLMMEAGRSSQESLLRAQLLEQQQPPYLALENAQQQLALAIARQRQSEHDAYLRQQELQQAASMVELAQRQKQQQQQQQQQQRKESLGSSAGRGSGSPAPADNRGFSSDFNYGMFSHLPSGALQQFSAGGYPGFSGMASRESMLPMHNQLRLEAALSGMDSSILGNYIRPQSGASAAGVSMDPFLAQAAAARAAGVGGASVGSLYGTNLAARSGDFGSMFGAGSINTPPAAAGGRGETHERKERGKSPHKQSRKKRANKKLDIPYTEYTVGDARDLSLPSDKGNLSAYQCLLREQILLFAVEMADIQCSAQGRNKPITLGQVGVLCRHCAKIPPGLRPCGAVYFPGKLSGLYQASQNMAINHFSKSCRSIPEDTRQRLLKLKEQKSSVLGGGKHFWANGARVAGVYETEEGQLRFKEEESKKSSSPTEEKEDATKEEGTDKVTEGEDKEKAAVEKDEEKATAEEAKFKEELDA